MADNHPDDHQHRRPHAAPMAAPFLEFDLGRELEQLRSEAAWSRGQNAKTIVKYEDFRIVLIALKTGAKLPDHRTRGRLSIHTLIGRLVVRAAGRTFDLPVGALLTLDHDLPHDVEALEESACLLTIAWPRRGEGPI
jgi:quercetin dioxygenase-like cupin family protein